MIFRSWIKISVALIVAASVATAALVVIAWYLAAALTPIHGYLASSSAVEKAIDALDEQMIGDETPATLRDIRRPLEDLIAAVNELTERKEDFGITPDADSLFWVAQWKLSLAQSEGEISEAVIEEGVLHLRRALEAEIAFRTNLIKELQNRSTWLFRVSIVLVICLAIAVASLVWLLKGRILRPLKSLREFLHKIERREYASFSDDSVDTLLEPLVTQYNAMVSTLAEHEAVNRSRQNALASEVRSASRALLEQHIELSRAQQQAAAGELSASIAHEIRNPLAGMTMALASLRDDLSDPELVERIELVINELDRVKRLLNNFLADAKVRPEKISIVKLRACIESLVQLAHYQIPEAIAIRVDIPDHIDARLPESGLRQAVLNLLLNAAHAIGARPGEIVVGARCDESALSIFVHDSGAGFSEDLLRNGIRPYNSQRGDGTGLGLATVRRFAQSQDGTVKLANGENGGGIVTIIFPTEKCANHE